MSTVQVRDVAPETLAFLKRRAAEQGASLSEYLRRELDRIAAMPSREDMLARVPRRGAPELPDPVDELEEARSERPGT
ncbi:hypothetical protein ACH0CV_06195 [Brachybacterium paraconglomeratum]|uniref:hypothetical protein n=1 Tax=Brachybacterium paraconglomeratum TaxID=173362 RepID=UPI00387A3AA1